MSEPFPSPAGAHRPDSSTAPSVEPTAAVQSVAVMRFKSCRWRRPPDEGTECCGHRDVLPIAGTTGFDPEAWCPECSFYKLRRTPKKRSPDEYRY
jgi:hypothetical protein